jgi:hypothetical protein
MERRSSGGSPGERCRSIMLLRLIQFFGSGAPEELLAQSQGRRRERRETS